MGLFLRNVKWVFTGEILLFVFEQILKGANKGNS